MRSKVRSVDGILRKVNKIVEESWVVEYDSLFFSFISPQILSECTEYFSKNKQSVHPYYRTMIHACTILELASGCPVAQVPGQPWAFCGRCRITSWTPLDRRPECLPSPIRLLRQPWRTSWWSPAGRRGWRPTKGPTRPPRRSPLHPLWPTGPDTLRMSLTAYENHKKSCSDFKLSVPRWQHCWQSGDKRTTQGGDKALANRRQ